MYYRVVDDTEKYANYLPSNYSSDLAEMFDGHCLVNKWQGMHFDLVDKEDTRPTPDFIGGDISACSKRLYDILKDLCCDSVEFLPCTVGKEMLPYYVMNVTLVSDAVDYEKSVFHRFPTSGRIMFFEKISFATDIQKSFFKIPELMRTHLFCVEQVKMILESVEASGVAFSNELFL